MRTLRLSLVATVILMVLEGLGGAVVAQDEEALASAGPYPVSSTLKPVDGFQGATLIVEEGRYLERGNGTYDTIEMDDDRLSGTLWNLWNIDHFKGRGYGSDGEVLVGTIELVNDEGSWVGTMRGYASMDPKTYQLGMELTDTGAHDGYSALLYATRPATGVWESTVSSSPACCPITQTLSRCPPSSGIASPRLVRRDVEVAACGDAGGSVEQHLKPVEEDRDILRRQPQDGFLGDAAVGLPDRLRRPHVGAELVDGLIDGVEGLVLDRREPVRVSGRVLLDVGVGGLGLVVLPLLLPTCASSPGR